MEVSIREMPLVEHACKCIAPLIFEQDGWLGVLGTCFGVRDAQDTIFLCAKHSLKDMSESSAINLPTSIGPKPQAVVVANIMTPRVTEKPFAEMGDFAVLRPTSPPVFSEDQFCPISLDAPQDMRFDQDVQVLGHPRTGVNGDRVPANQNELHVVGNQERQKLGPVVREVGQVFLIFFNRA